MIYIDFQSGAHGNYLEFVCNKFLAGVDCNQLPFNTLRASHNKGYRGKKQFEAGHYFEYHGQKNNFFDSKIISIQITHDDLLPLSSVSLLRAGDHNINNNQLEIDTYHKLNNKSYKWVLDNILDNFFQTQIQQSYNSVKDDSWPRISSLTEFDNLPEWIKSECLEKHNLKLFELTAENPDCPRHILREFFKIGFKNPEQAGFITQQEKMTYDTSNDVLVFAFSNFYNTENFVNQLRIIAKWCNLELQQLSILLETHSAFLNNQPYSNSKKLCDTLIKKILQDEIFELPELDLFQESYISAQLENHYHCELPAELDNWYKNSEEIYKAIR
jgi:hypothetical protein